METPSSSIKKVFTTKAAAAAAASSANLKKDKKGKKDKKNVQSASMESKSVHTSKKEVPKEEPNQVEMKPTITTTSTRKPVNRPPSKKAATWETEYQQLLIKFPGLSIQTKDSAKSLTNTNKANDAGRKVMRLQVPILDPDFPYDLERIDLEVTIPSKYPQVHPTFKLLNEQIPPAYQTMVEQRLTAYINSLPPNELCLRPVIRYLENNFEQLITERAASTRFKFFSPATIISTSSKTTNGINNISPYITASSDVIAFNQSEDINTSEEFIAFSHSPPPPITTSSQVGNVIFKDPMPMLLENTSKSDVRGDDFTLELISPKMQNISYLYLSSLNVSLKCLRCSKQFVISSSLRPFVDRFETCPHCSSKIPMLWQPSLVHSHSSRVGRVTVGRAHPQDLLPSTLQLACLECSHTSSSRDIAIEVQQVQFTNDVKGLAQKKTKKSKADIIAPLQIGQPLPRKGACEHFTKSFRWYRFPCCKRAFACEYCHLKASPECATLDPAECQATRFICGFCSRELSISSCKVCVCGHDWSSGATPKPSAHWEGGKGCRNVTAMSRKDSRKYKSK